MPLKMGAIRMLQSSFRPPQHRCTPRLCICFVLVLAFLLLAAFLPLPATLANGRALQNTDARLNRKNIGNTSDKCVSEIGHFDPGWIIPLGNYRVNNIHAQEFNICTNSNLSKPFYNFVNDSKLSKLGLLINGTSYHYFCTVGVGLTLFLVGLALGQLRTDECNTNVKAKKTRIRISISIKNIRRKIPSKIHFNVNSAINYATLLKNVRARLKIKPTQSVYLFSNSEAIHPGTTWEGGRIRLICVGENRMGAVEQIRTEASSRIENHGTGLKNRRSKKSSEKFCNKINQKRKSQSKYATTLLYSNTNGLSLNKVESIRQESIMDSFVLGTEWNKIPSDTAQVADYFGTYAIVKSCHQFTYSNGIRIPLERKKKGYGTGIVAKDSGTLTPYTDLDKNGDLNFEILPCELKLLDDLSVGCVHVYRSPSMTCEHEIREFYAKISEYINHMKNVKQLKCIVYIGDPNTESSKLASTLEKDIMQKYMLVDLIEGIPTRTISETQPDSCYAWFNCTDISCEAEVVGQLHAKMDHRAIRVRFRTNQIKPEKAQYKEVKYKKRKPEIKDEDIAEFLRNEFSVWQSKYKSLIYDVNGDERQIRISDSLVDSATCDFLDIIKQTKDFAWSTVTASWPVVTPDFADPLTVSLTQLSAKLGELSLTIQNEGHSGALMDEFRNIEKQKLKLMREKVQQRIELCMNHQLNKSYSRNTDHLFNWTKKLLARGGFAESMNDERTQEEIEKEKRKRKILPIRMFIIKLI